MSIATNMLHQISHYCDVKLNLDLNGQNLNADDIRQIVVALNQNANIKEIEINVSNNDLLAVGAKEFLACKFLTALDITGNNVGNEGLSALLSHPFLKKLIAGSNNITQVENKIVSPIVELDLNFNQLSNHLRTIAMCCTKLIFLNLTGNMLQLTDFNVLTNKDNFPKLQCLNISNNTGLDENVISALSNRPSLTTLTTNGIKVSTEIKNFLNSKKSFQFFNSDPDTEKRYIAQPTDRRLSFD